ncbi:MAG: nucleotidyltransferase domain-containing protein [Candidatus Margulisbacteria bacterium]|jgi:predicted nucleotidyltransferase|nr:nucleotidyltransferase domain-containing protein [Candidatus Margulisiibacteriota bacterium]
MNLQKIPAKYRKDIETAADMLRAEGCSSVYLFGSLLTGKNRNDSDYRYWRKGPSPG